MCETAPRCVIVISISSKWPATNRRVLTVSIQMLDKSMHHHDAQKPQGKDSPRAGSDTRGSRQEQAGSQHRNVAPK